MQKDKFHLNNAYRINKKKYDCKIEEFAEINLNLLLLLFLLIE